MLIIHHQSTFICIMKKKRLYIFQDSSIQLPSLESRGQHDNGNHYADCNHEDKTRVKFCLSLF